MWWEAMLMASIFIRLIFIGLFVGGDVELETALKPAPSTASLT